MLHEDKPLALDLVKMTAGPQLETKHAAENLIAKPDFALTKNGRPCASLSNRLLAIKADSSLSRAIRYNIMAERIEIVGPVPWQTKGEFPRPWSETAPYDTGELAIYLSDEWDVTTPPNGAFEAAKVYAGQNPYNPFIELLKSIEWDGVERAGHLLNWYLGAEDCEYTYDAEWLTLSGLIMRQAKPGVKFDCVLVLKGGQGIGKSTFCALLGANDEWVARLQINLESQKAREVIRGKAVVEVEELASLNNANVEAIKSFFSGTHDDYRDPYAHVSTQHKRTNIFIGTTNKREFLVDITGERRFVPIACAAVDPVKSFYTDRNDGTVSPEAAHDFLQALAEVYHKYKENGRSLPLTMPRRSIEAWREAQSKAKVENPVETALEAYLTDLSRDLVSVEELYEACIEADAIRAGRDKRFAVSGIREVMANAFPDWVYSVDASGMPDKRRFNGSPPVRYYARR